MRVTSIQLELRPETKAQTLERVLGELDRAVGSDLLLLPELWSCGYFSFNRYRDDSETLTGPLLSAIADKARLLRAHIFAGSLVECRGSDLFNTSVLLSPSGQILATYRKIHLFGFQSDERRLLTAGDHVTVVDTPWGRTGLTTCYDLRFPELYRRMLDQGASVFLVTSAWPQARLEAWRLFNRARAHENLAYLISCNCAGINNNVTLAGHSMVVDPLGAVVAEAGETGCQLSAEIDPQMVAQARHTFTAIHDRVPFLNPPLSHSSPT
ncbi:MAG: carbon-nitrogen family hydrolase [Planctomycetota bacterium]